MQFFSPAQVATHLTGNTPLLLDVREPWEFEICHITDSKLIPMGKIPMLIAELNPLQEIILICHHGIRSRQVGLYLQAQGFTKLINLQGGLDAWARDIDTQMATY